jgi:hypothetical protein
VNFFTHNKKVHSKSDRFRGKYAIAFASIPITGLARIMMHLINKGQAAATGVKVDAIADVFGLLYRVSEGSKFLGTYYQRLDGGWIAQSASTDNKQCFADSDEACLWLQH